MQKLGDLTSKLSPQSQNNSATTGRQNLEKTPLASTGRQGGELGLKTILAGMVQALGRNGNGREPESVIAIGARIVARHKANNGFRGNGSGGVETPADGSNDLDDTGIIDGTEFGYDTSDNG